LTRIVAAGEPVAREQLAPLRALAARRVHQGLGLDAFLRSYRIAAAGVWEACAQEASRLDVSRDAGLELARVVLDAIERITTCAAEDYLREEARLRREGARRSRDLVARLIAGRSAGETWRLPAGPFVTVVGRIETASLPAGDALQLVRDLLEEHAGPSAIAVREDEIVLIGVDAGGVAAARERAGAAHALDVRFGVSVPVADATGVEHAYREATLSLAYSSPERPIVSLADLSTLECALVGADGTARAVIAAKAGGVGDLSDEEVATVRAFAGADLNVGRAAAELDIHPNTVRYRLQRIAGAAGHDPRTFAGLVELVCILEVTRAA
jgi:hypothetical protein